MTNEAKTERHIRFSRWGMAEDPRGMHCKFNRDGREQLATITDVYYSERGAAGFFLKLRYFNGEPAKDIAAGCVRLVLPEPLEDYANLFTCPNCGAKGVTVDAKGFCQGC